MDCMEGMKQFPDGYFELAIVDPPYGDGISGGNPDRFGERFDRYKLGGQQTYRPFAEINAPERERERERSAQQFTNLATQEHGVSRTGGTWAAKFSKKSFRGMLLRGRIISRNCSASHRTRLSGGGNYFNLPSTRCFLIWRKVNVPEKFSMAMAEYAWTSFNDNAKVFDFSAVGQPGRFHPTQKPVELYKWILTNYAKPGDKILDTHVGSASSLIACHELGFKYVGFEIDADYYNLAKKRLEQETAQMNILDLMRMQEGNADDS